MNGPLFEVDRLEKRFGGVRAIEELSLDISSGEIRALIGPNGAGKTTFINLITGVYRPSSGDIRFDGRSLVGLRPSQITARGIARTFQHPALFQGLTVGDNVMAGASLHQPRTLLRDMLGAPGSRRRDEEAYRASRHWLQFVGLSAREDEPVGRLTPAERRLVEVARAMATKPKLLLLDEPFAGMTQEEAEELLPRIAEIRSAGTTILLIDHNIRMVMQLADRVTVLSFGRKIGEGSPGQVQSSDAVIEAYLGAAADA